MRKYFTSFILISLFIPNSAFSQVSYTALDTLPMYNEEFLYGTNPGYYDKPDWDDISKANIARGTATVNGIGLNTLRPNLPHSFVEEYGYNIRLKEFKYYQSIGLKDLTVFLGTYFNPKSTTPLHVNYIKKYMDSTNYGTCTEPYTQSFKNLYKPIWDNGANGTPVNEDNYFAVYVYNTISTYKGLAKFWEIINEPDFCGSPSCSDLPGVKDNWWEYPPKPCDLVNLRTPVFHYIRMLRIAYEVGKYVDPNCYIALGGIGFQSFLDVMLRYTDNPVDGSVTAEYPLTGGAYFEVVSYHAYPQYRLSRYNNTTKGRDYFRFSDAAVDTVIAFKRSFERTLLRRGYGTQYPQKLFIITEYNIPRKKYRVSTAQSPTTSDHIGSPEAQRNAMIKMFTQAQKHDIKQVQTFQLGDTEDENLSKADGFDNMGFFLNMKKNVPYQQVMTPTAVATKTMIAFLQGYHYDPSRTTAMAMPVGVEGAAFKSKTGEYRYVLWARTKTDDSENATATYSFPTGFGLKGVTSYDWNYATDKTKFKGWLPTGITLGGTPQFFSEKNTLDIEDDLFGSNTKFKIYPNPNFGKFGLKIEGYSGTALLNVYTSNGILVKSEKIEVLEEDALSNLELRLDKGVYMAQILTSRKVYTQKLIIE